MAKFNNKRKKGKGGGNKANGYFAQNVQRDGKDFLKRKNPRDISRDAPRIVKDIAFAGGNVKLIAPFFMDRTFVSNITRVIEDKVLELNATVIGLRTYLDTNKDLPPTDKTHEIESKKQKELEAYVILHTGLNNILNKIMVPCDNLYLYTVVYRDLKSLSLQLSKHKYQFV